jgi:hypothetical protein
LYKNSQLTASHAPVLSTSTSSNSNQSIIPPPDTSISTTTSKKNVISIELAPDSGCPDGIDKILIERNIQPTEQVYCRIKTVFLNYSGSALKNYSVIYGHFGGKGPTDDVVGENKINVTELPSGKLIDNDFSRLAQRIIETAARRVSEVQQTEYRGNISRYVSREGEINNIEGQLIFCANFKAVQPAIGTLRVCASSDDAPAITDNLTLATGTYPFSDALHTANILANNLYLDMGADERFLRTGLSDWAYRPEGGGYWLMSFFPGSSVVTPIFTHENFIFITIRIGNTGEACVVKKTLLTEDRPDLMGGSFSCPR